MNAPAVPSSPPWRMAGECMVSWVRAVPQQLRARLPRGVRPLAGPAAVVAVSYSSSPVGPYLELSVGVPARLGLRPGLCVVFQLVSIPGARSAYQANWGLPASVGSMEWIADGDERELRCIDVGWSMRGVPFGPSIPAVLPIRSVQRRADGPVVLPRRMVALVRLARTAIICGDGGPGRGDDVDALLATLAGPHSGALMSGVRILAHPARHPAGLWSSLGAPLTVPDVAVGATTVASRTGRLAQLVRAQPSHG